MVQPHSRSSSDNNSDSEKSTETKKSMALDVIPASVRSPISIPGAATVAAT